MLEGLGSILTNTYSEDRPHAHYCGGKEVIGKIEDCCKALALAVPPLPLPLPQVGKVRMDATDVHPSRRSWQRAARDAEVG